MGANIISVLSAFIYRYGILHNYLDTIISKRFVIFLIFLHLFYLFPVIAGYAYALRDAERNRMLLYEVSEIPALIVSTPPPETVPVHNFRSGIANSFFWNFLFTFWIRMHPGTGAQNTGPSGFWGLGRIHSFGRRRSTSPEAEDFKYYCCRNSPKLSRTLSTSVVPSPMFRTHLRSLFYFPWLAS